MEFKSLLEDFNIILNEDKLPKGKEKIYIGEVDNMKCFFVDGDYVRDNYDIEFNIGGNGFRYPKFLKNEIWIENTENNEDNRDNLMHEISESFLMKYGKYSYSKAHAVASSIEVILRKMEHKGTKNARSK